MPKRYILVLIMIVVVIFVGVWLLISLITRDRTPEDQNEPVESSQRSEALSEGTNSVTYTVYGPVVAEEQRRGIRITVTENERRVEVLEGYYETVGKSQTFENNQPAYDTLLIALDGAGFDQYDRRNTIDERSQCPTGNRFVFEAQYEGNESLRSWTTTCRKTGNFQGDPALVKTLMQNQIPEYKEFVSDVDI